MRKDRSCGFTLVELMVVIAIMGVLISFLLPSLAKAREAARTMQCLANTRQILIGWHIYADTYQDWAVPAHTETRRFYPTGTVPGVSNDTRYWPHMMKNFINLSAIPDNLGRFAIGGAVWNTNYARNYYDRSILNCPTLKTEYRVSSPIAPHIGMMMYGFGGRDGWGAPISRRDDIKRPSATIGFSDVKNIDGVAANGGGGSGNAPSGLSGYGGGDIWVRNDHDIVGDRRHNEQVNYGYADGHAGTGAYGTSTEPSSVFHFDYKFGGGLAKNN